MPLITSFGLIRPNREVTPSPTSPHQLAFMASLVVGWAMMAGVHSTVWIFAMSAALISRARSKIWSSDHWRYSARRRSQMALCSREKSVCSSPRPTQKLPATPDRST
jgi:hypothetical protein